MILIGQKQKLQLYYKEIGQKTKTAKRTHFAVTAKEI